MEDRISGHLSPRGGDDDSSYGVEAARPFGEIDIDIELTSRQKYGLAALLSGVLLSRLPFRAELPYGLDSIQLVLALDHFDVRLHQPHPPGYFLFVMAGRLSRLLFPDANSAFVSLNILFSCLAVWLVFLLSRRMFGVQHAFYAATFMATSPLFWHHERLPSRIWQIAFSRACWLCCAGERFRREPNGLCCRELSWALWAESGRTHSCFSFLSGSFRFARLTRDEFSLRWPRCC